MSEPITLETARLRLVAADAALVKLELQNRPSLFAALRVSPPADWPPPLNDNDSFGFFLKSLESDPSFAGWGYWYVIENNSEDKQLIGICGFKGKPDKSATVEIGYSIVPSRQNLGFASEAIAAMIAWAKKRGAKSVIAETYPELAPSVRVMEKLGLVFEGAGSEEGVVRYRRAL